MSVNGTSKRETGLDSSTGFMGQRLNDQSP
jgi:hypothetical protein